MLTQAKPSNLGSRIPFSADRLDRLMDEAGMDIVVANSKHNVQYLLGGHRAFFFDYMDAMGLSRYLPIFVYVKGAAIRQYSNLRPRFVSSRRNASASSFLVVPGP